MRKGDLRLSPDAHDKLLTLTGDKNWKELLKQLDVLASAFDDEFKSAEITAEQLLYYRGKLDGVAEMVNVIKDLKDYIRYIDADDD